MSSHSFVKFIAGIKVQIHMTKMMKAAILSICQRLYVNNMLKKFKIHFCQFANILPWCYLMDTVYDCVS